MRNYYGQQRQNLYRRNNHTNQASESKNFQGWISNNRITYGGRK